MLNKVLKNELDSRHILVSEFAVMCNLPTQTVQDIYSGKETNPDFLTVVAMANALGMSVGCLVGQCPYTQEERTFLSIYRQCGERGKRVIKGIADLLSAKKTENKEAME